MNVVAKAAKHPLIAEAFKTPSVEALYREVDALTPIEVEAAPDGNWFSKTVDGKTTITVAPTNRPATALAHELLHARLKSSGYRQYLTIVSMDEKRKALVGIAMILDNELQHHRMFDAFVAAGLDPTHFYHDDDIEALKHVREELKRLHKDAPPEEYLRLFVTVIAPGGVGSDDERNEIKAQFKKQCRAKTWDILTKVERAISDWRKSNTLDAGPTIIRILRVLGDYRKSWIGFGKDNLDDGLFVGERFTVEQAIAWNEQQQA